MPFTLFGLLLISLTTGCSSLSYYSQAVSGHLDLLAKTRPVEEVIQDESTPANVSARLRRLPDTLSFARDVLKLPDSGSYQSYAELGRPAATWVVFHAPKYSTRLEPSCFLIVGCLSYQGWFAKQDAESAAEVFRKQGFDVYLSPSPAYSTLGWFDDPVLSTMLQWDEISLTGVIFHELTHQKLYVADDSMFNESLANFVEREGTRLFYQGRLDAEAWHRYEESRRLRAEFRQLVIEHRKRLQRAYERAEDDEQRARRKAELIAELRQSFEQKAQADAQWDRYRHWFEASINNAKMASIAVYNRFLPGFAELFRQTGGNFDEFWRRVDELAAMSKEEREQAMLALSAAQP